MGTLEGLVVGGKDVDVAGDPRRGEVGQVLAALFLLINLSLVAVPPSVSTLCAAGEGRGKKLRINRRY